MFSRARQLLPFQHKPAKLFKTKKKPSHNSTYKSSEIQFEGIELDFSSCVLDIYAKEESAAPPTCRINFNQFRKAFSAYQSKKYTHGALFYISV